MKKLYFFLIALMTCCISASAIDYYLIGGFNGWTTMQASCKFTAQGDGTYVLDLNGTLTSGFKINDGTWDNANANFGGTATLTPGVEYNLTCSGQSGNIPLAENIVNPHLLFNPTAKTLLVTGEEKAAEYVYAIHGDILTGSWQDIDLTENNGKWELPQTTMLAGNFGIKKIDASTGSQADWISSASGSAVELDKAMPCKTEGTNWAIAAGDYAFSFDPEAMTLTITGTSGGGEVVIDYSSWYVNILGDFNEWKDNGLNPTKEGMSIHTDLPIGTSAFKVKVWNGADIYYTTGGAIPQDEWVTVPVDEFDIAGMTIEGAKAGESFNVEFDCANNAVKVTSVGGGEDPEPEPEPEPELPETITGELSAATMAGDAAEDDWKADGSNYYIPVADTPLNAGDITITVNGGTTPARLYKTSTGVIDFRFYLNAKITIAAPEGYQISKVEAYSAQNKSTSKLANLIPESGWTSAEATDKPTGMKYGVIITPTGRAVTNTLTLTNTSDKASTMRINEIKVTADKVTSGVEDVTVSDDNAPVEYYNLNGIRVANPSNGIFIRRQGNTVTKVIL